ncbi:Ig-like domain-containing protein [Agromyces endophyticus]|uniref:beta strand repeat-containing protein n=1 Tax=Agromyces sp. H17E-10 TaxID=2932244 RepID=UPI001FCFC0C4|nr:Ig-like domain-containing protein [Agromyces sp. H17E-10]UOQ90153.1 Ig-like domain-containing protein [Agromyces sp. H17E-10]
MSYASEPRSTDVVASAATDAGVHRPRLLALVLLTVAAVVLAVATPSVAFAVDDGMQLRYACAQKSNGLMRAASAPGDCRPKQETAVAIWPGPTTLCIQPDGSVRRYVSAKSCTGTKPAGTKLVVPTTNGQPVYFCAPSSGVLRRVSASTACLSGERRWVIGNHVPSDLTLSNDDVLENEPAGTVVGTLALVDEDPAATPAFTLVSGTGDADNSSFTITGSTLKTAASFDYEVKQSYSIRVRGSDGYGGSREEAFTIGVLDVVEDLPPTAVDDSATVDEDSGATAIDVLANDENGDGGPIAISQVSQPADGTVEIAGDEASLTYEPGPAYCNDPPGTTPDTFTYTLAPGGSTATVSVRVTCVDDLPVAADDEATVNEDAPATAIDVLANDEDLDGGPRSITSVVQPDHGTVAITGGGTGLTYAPDADYCNAPGGEPDVFSYTLTPGDGNAQVSVTVTCIADAPVADDESFGDADAAVGNTAYVIDDPTDAAPTVAGPHLVVTGDLLEGDTDGDQGTELAIVPGTFATQQGGSVTLEADGDVVYTPPAGCTTVSDGFDYTVTDQDAVAPLTGTGHVTIAIGDCVWYVSNDAAGNSGTSTAPFDTIAQAASASAAGDDLFVFDGDGSTTGYSTAITLDDDQQLIGEASDLVVDGRTLHQGDPAKRPTITMASGTFVIGLGVGNRVAGLEVHPVTAGGGIGVVDIANDPGGDATIDDVRIVDAIDGGIGLALQGLTGTNVIGDLDVDVIGTGVFVDSTQKVVFDPAATVKIRTSGTGWTLLARLCNLEGSQIDQLVTTGVSNGGGVNLQQTTGALAFGDLDIRTLNSSQAAFSLSLTGPVTVPASATAKIVATNGPAVSVGASSGSQLSFDEVTATKSGVYGINIDQIGAGTFSAAAGELSSGPFGLTPFRVRGGTGDISYGGSITDGPATTSVDIQNRAGGTVTLSGSITDGSDAGGGIVVANNTGGATVLSGPSKHLETGTADGIRFASSSGHSLSITGGGLDVTTTSGMPLEAALSGTIVVTGAGNRLSSTTGTALTIALTGIGADDVTFQRIASNGAPSGIVLAGTGTAGGLHVTGGGSTVQGGDASGGTIAAATGDGISLQNTADASFRNVRVENSAGNGISGIGVTGFSFLSGTVTGAGDAAGEDGIAFDGAGIVNLSGVVDISNNVLTSNEASGISIANRGGTISQLKIDGNRIADAGDLLTPGSAVVMSATGSSAGAATISKGTISSNVISDFRAGDGIRVLGGNTESAIPSTLGASVVAITGNRMDGGDGGPGQQPDTFADVRVFGAGVGNFDVSNNGTNAEPLRHFECEVIDIATGGAANVTATVNANVIAAGNGSGCVGISAEARSFGSVGADLAARVTNNQVRSTAGPGISVVASGAGEVSSRVKDNTVWAPTGGYAGIFAASGEDGDIGARLCLAITGNTTAGGTDQLVGFRAPGIELAKEADDLLKNPFGIEGLPAGLTASPNVEFYVNSLNASTPGDLGVGGTFLSKATAGFSPCATAQ